jgi:GxxExxY protein
MTQLLHDEITQQVIGAAFEVHGILGYGFLEKVYQRAMGVELALRGLHVNAEVEMQVTYKQKDVGNYKADLLVNRCVVVELKASKFYNHEDEAQLLNELKASAIKVGLLINFGRVKVEFRRMVF